jgi:hypothetical protein
MDAVRAVVSRMWRGRSGPAGVRTVLGCLVIAAVCLVQLGSSSAADSTFSNGSAVAGAQAIAVAPTVSSLSIGVILGTTIANYTNQIAQALAQTFDGGALVVTLEAPSCSTGAPSSVQPSDFPTPAQAESTNGNQTVNLTSYNTPSPTAGSGVGYETATATTEPSGSSTNTITSLNLAGLVDISGATSSSTADVQNSDTRYASATADIASVSLANGLVVMKGLHWVATQTSGATNTSTAAFDIASLTVAGTSIPVANDSATTVLPIINTVLSPIGLQVDWPQAATLPDGTISLSPLKVGLDNSALGQEVVGVNLIKAQTVRNEVEQALLNINCETADVFTDSDVAVGVLAGAGDLDVDLGGVHALTNDQAAVSPFGSGGTGLPAGNVSDLSTSATLPSSILTLPSTSILPTGTGTTTGTPSTGGNSTGGPAGGTTKVSLGPIQKSSSCQSLGATGAGCSSSNMALPVGLIGLGLLGGLFIWDAARQRRRRRLLGMEAK